MSGLHGFFVYKQNETAASFHFTSILNMYLFVSVSVSVVGCVHVQACYLMEFHIFNETLLKALLYLCFALVYVPRGIEPTMPFV